MTAGHACLALELHRVDDHPQKGCLGGVRDGVEVFLTNKCLKDLKKWKEEGREGKEREGTVLVLWSLSPRLKKSRSGEGKEGED